MKELLEFLLLFSLSSIFLALPLISIMLAFKLDGMIERKEYERTNKRRSTKIKSRN